MGCEAYFDEIKKKHAYFHYHLNYHYIPDNAGYVKLEFLESHQNTLLTYHCVEIVSIRLQSFGFEAYLDAIKKKKVYFHYHLNCQHIPDNAGYIKLEFLESHQNTGFT